MEVKEVNKAGAALKRRMPGGILNKSAGKANKHNQYSAVSNPNFNPASGADKIFANLSFGAAIAKAALSIKEIQENQEKNIPQKSSIDDAVSSILYDINTGGLKASGCPQRQELKDAEEFIFKILDKYFKYSDCFNVNKEESINLNDARYLLRRQDLTLSDSERQQLQSLFQKYNTYDWITEQDISSDQALLFETISAVKEKLNSYEIQTAYIRHVMHCIQDNRRRFDKGYSINAVFDNFKNNIAPKLTIDELRIVHALLTNTFSAFDDENTAKETAAAAFDYRKLASRRLASFISEDNRYKNDFYKEFLFCSDDEFKEKISRLNSRMFLKQELNAGRLPFYLWKQLLDMDDAEYGRLAVPIKQRPAANFDADKYRKDMQEKIKEPLQFDRDEIQRLTLDSFSLNLGRAYSFDKRMDFKKFEPKCEPVSKLPETGDLMKKLLAYGRINLEIKNRGGAKPVNTEKADIKKEDETRLGKIENAGIKIKYGERINWSNFKIARDIMQNFYDGNGYTLEGVKLKVIKDKNNKDNFKIRIEGLGLYDYSHLDSLGDSAKDDDALAAGNFGEGTRIIAVNLLSKLDADSVKYGSGDWSMEFKRSSDDIKTADMIQILTKNKERINGSYIEFNTSNKDLVRTVLASKDYFYHPGNPDFQNFDYENEFFGIKILPEAGQTGNLYLIQRYEHNGENENSLHNVSLVFKKMPNDPELVRLNGGEEYTPNTGRDRVEISAQTLRALFARYIKTMKDEDLAKLICTFEPFFNTETSEQYKFIQTVAILLSAALDAAQARKLGINFENYVCTENKKDIEFARAIGFKTAVLDMEKAGMERYIHEHAKIPFETPDENITKKIRLLNEAVRVFAECADLSTIDVIRKGEADTPKYPYTTEQKDCIKAEAIIRNGEYKGHWVKKDAFIFDQYSSNLAAWLHELSHKAGSDGSEPFAEQLKKMQQFIISALIYNPEALGRIKILSELYNGEKLEDKTFNEKQYELKIKSRLENLPAYTQISADSLEQSSTPSSIFAMQELMPGFRKKPAIRAVYKKNEKEPPYAPVSAMPDAAALAGILHSTGSVSAEIKDRGGAKPVKTEKAEIKKGDEAKLGKTENAKIKIKYGRKIKWGSFKTARDIMQNFYDGNGHTLEGVKINIIKTAGGKYKIRIDGLGTYDYSHLQSIGDSTKEGDFSAAGSFGEGTRILAVNLLSKLDTHSVKYGSGDWSMEFKRSSDDIKTADMTQVLTKNKERINGNYIEFDTEDEELVKTVLESKDYFYHPDNPDFQNLDFENDYFGFRVQKGRGNIYYIQRYQTADRRGMRGLNAVFKKQQNAVHEYIKNKRAQEEKKTQEEETAEKQASISIMPKKGGILSAIRGLFAKRKPIEITIPDKASFFHQQILKFPKHDDFEDFSFFSPSAFDLSLRHVNTGRDRNALEADDINALAFKYAKTMTNDELISAIESFEPLLTSAVDLDEYDPSAAFMSGIIEEAAERNIKFNSKDAKIVWVDKNQNIPENAGRYLNEQGYKYGHKMYSQIGLQSAESLYNDDHKKHSAEPSKEEAQKLEILNTALKLFKENDKCFCMPEMGENSVYVYEKEDSENDRDYHSLYTGDKFQAVLIDRKTLAKDSFTEALARVVSETRRRNDDFACVYTYDLTDLIMLELDSFLKNPETAQKLKVLEKLYSRLQC